MADVKSSFKMSCRDPVLPFIFSYDLARSPTSILPRRNRVFGCCSGLADVLFDEMSASKFHQPRVVLFGSGLKVGIPDLGSGDFGLKTRKICGPVSPSPSPSSAAALSLTEMELSEEYTRVVSYGPNPKIVHFFDDSVVRSSDGDIDVCRGEKAFFGGDCRRKEVFFAEDSPEDSFSDDIFGCSLHTSDEDDDDDDAGSV